MAGRKLKVWNGRGGNWREIDTVYVCAYSQTDAVSLITEAGHPLMTLYELRVYWNAGAWGRYMDGITPERGVWIQRVAYGPVERVI